VILPANYATATAFRQALEARLMNLSRSEGVDIQRLRRQVSFDRLLARLFKETKAPWALKGGYAMELRLAIARATRDIDLTLIQIIAGDEKDRIDRILEMLQAAAAIDLGDAFAFLIGEHVVDLDAAPYGGGRFPVEARMDGRVFARFHLDVGVGDVVIEPLENIQGRDWLDFAEISTPAFPTISREQQFAEKYHAYTLPRQERENSRVRDLVDMLLLIRTGMLNNEKTGAALKLTFSKRRTHALPKEVPPPPPAWEKPFTVLAAECELDENIDKAITELKQLVGTA
jgi:hypothetical protein